MDMIKVPLYLKFVFEKFDKEVVNVDNFFKRKSHNLNGHKIPSRWKKAKFK